jgi:hypothetical protein
VVAVVKGVVGLDGPKNWATSRIGRKKVRQRAVDKEYSPIAAG